MCEGKWPQTADGFFISVRALAQAYAASAIPKRLILLVVVDRNLRTMGLLTLRFVRIAEDQHIGLLHREADAFGFSALVDVGKKDQLSPLDGLLEACQSLLDSKRAGPGYYALDWWSSRWYWLGHACHSSFPLTEMLAFSLRLRKKLAVNPVVEAFFTDQPTLPLQEEQIMPIERTYVPPKEEDDSREKGSLPGSNSVALHGP